MDDAFADILNQYVSRAAYTSGQLARLSEVPKSTIVNWITGRVQHPRDWQSLARLLAVLRLERWEADRVLQAAGHPPLADLEQIAGGAGERALLRSWQDESDRPARRAPSTTAPFQAIADTPFFVGREEIRRRIRRYLRAGGLCTLQGMPGVGKTTLAVRLAYELRSDFPDGVLWARLSASDSMSILSTFAHAFGVDLSIYGDLDSRARVVRNLLVDRRLLMILDDAVDSAGVETLLPPSGPTAVLITTRKRNLRVAQQGRRVELQPFTPDGSTSLQLFSQVLGAERVQAEEKALLQLAQYVGHLPLALTMAAGRLAWEPGWNAAGLLARLQTMSKPLDALRAEELTVYQVFHASIEALPADSHNFFAALSAFGGHDFNAQAAAGASGVTPEEAQAGLRLFHSLSLLETVSAERFRLHPLLQQFAAQLPQPDGLSRRFVNYFAGLLATEPDEITLGVELPHIAHALDFAAQSGRQNRRAELALGLGSFRLRQGRPRDARQVLKQPFPDKLAAILHARRLLLLAQAARHERRFADADEYLAQARARNVGQDTFQAAYLFEKGSIAACRGDYERANTCLVQALNVGRGLEQPALLSGLLKELGATAVARGRYEEAQGYYLEARRLAQAHAPGDLPGLLRCLGSIAIIARDDYEGAEALFTEGLALARKGQQVHDAALILNNLTAVAWQAGEFDQARRYLQEAREIAQQLQVPATVSIIEDNAHALAQNERPHIIFD